MRRRANYHVQDTATMRAAKVGASQERLANSIGVCATRSRTVSRTLVDFLQVALGSSIRHLDIRTFACFFPYQWIYGVWTQMMLRSFGSAEPHCSKTKMLPVPNIMVQIPPLDSLRGCGQPIWPIGHQRSHRDPPDP